jgi:hypothetical protein
MRNSNTEYQRHCRQFFDQFKPATATESQLVQEIADTSWRINRVPLLEAALLDGAATPFSALATLALHSQRLSSQFQEALNHLRKVQSGHEYKGLPQRPTELISEDGFVFSEKKKVRRPPPN